MAEQWEYLVKTSDELLRSEESGTISELDQLKVTLALEGQDGWDLVATIEPGWWIFKRPLAEPHNPDDDAWVS
jgi:hypothetical protein